MTPRTGKELVAATRPFAEESRTRSWWYVCSTLLALLGALIMAGVAPWWPARLAGSVLGGLVMARAFILFHDFMHGSILRGSRLGKVVLYAVGSLLLAPPRSWRKSHNFHHANVAKLIGPTIGSFPIMTTATWRQAGRWQRFRYRLSRHPLTILSAYLTVFGFTLTVQPLLTHPTKNWDSAFALAGHGGIIAGLWWLGGPTLAFFAFLLPFALAAALGAYLFYAQHNFKGVRLLGPDDWTYTRAALESASFLRMGRLMRWFTGDIGYHHVHHLNPGIPFYRLEQAMSAIPELQRPTATSLRPRDVLACFRANLWDQESASMVSYRQANARREHARTSYTSQERGESTRRLLVATDLPQRPAGR